MKQMIWNGQGPIYFGTFDTTKGKADMGYLVDLRPIGCANSVLTTAPERETKQIKESCSGKRLGMAEITTGMKLTVKIEMAQFDRDALGLAFSAKATSQTGGSVTGEAFHTVKAGDYVFLKNPNAKSIVIVDSDTGPTTLTADTHYKVIDAAHGVIQMLNLGSLVQPFKVSYEFTDYGNIAAFTADAIKTGIVYTGKAEDGSKARVIIPKVSLAMSDDFSWLSEEEATLSLEGEASYVRELATEGSLYGPFMRIDGLPD